MPQTLYIIDGHWQIYRAYYAPFGELSSPTGEPTRATYVFCSMLLRLIADHRPGYLAMAVDGPAEKLHRRELYPQYKITRKPAPEDFQPQVRRIVQIVEAMGIPILQAEGFEADDVMATAVEKFASPEIRVMLVSRDKDLEQLIGEYAVLYDPMKDRMLDAAAILEDKGYPPEKVVEVQSLMGDSIDNIPGTPGIGPKTAASLIGRYGSAEAVLAHAEELKPKLRENLLKNAENIALARRLVTLERHAPAELDLEKMRFSGIRGEAIRPIFAELGFNRLLGQLDALGVGGKSTVDLKSLAAAQQQTTAEDFNYTCIDTPGGLDELVKQLAGVRRLAVDTETTSIRPMWAELVGISLAWKPGAAVYLPIKAPLGAKTLELKDVRAKLAPILADPAVEKIGQNLKYDMTVLSRAGMELAGEMFDTMIAAHVLDSTRNTYRLDALAAEFLNHRCIPIEQLIGRGKKQIKMDAVPIETVTPYAAEDADITLQLAEVLEKKLAAEALTDLFRRLEMPLMPVLERMERDGVAVDPEALKRMETELSGQAEILRERIMLAAGSEFNPDSPKQLAAVLFEKLQLPVLKKTKTGSSTDSSVLEQLAVLHELPGLLLDYRKLSKLLSTYLKALGRCIHPQTHRVHTNFHQTGTSTGRLSSSNPNLQNIPIRSEEGRQIRSAFVAPKGNVLLSADYSQVELRVLAHLCEDATLRAAFKADEDIHRIVAAEVFDVAVDEVTPAQRAKAKTVNFGIIYGQTARGLSISLRIPHEEARRFIERYRGRFGKIDEFLHSCTAAAKENGYVETISGRRRRIPQIDSPNPQHRAAAERLAINSVVQGSAADLIKQAMINIAARIKRENRPLKMLLQIHDELLFELPADTVESARKMIVSQMTGAIELSVPLKVDVGVGKNWMEAK